MIRLLPFIVIPILILGSLWYWRNIISKEKPISETKVEDSIVEVPKSLPGATIEERVKDLEEIATNLAAQVNSLNSGSKTGSDSDDAATKDLQAQTVELKARVAALEKAPVQSSTASKSPLYIPLGAGGGPWADQNWNTLNEYQASINPDNYSGYSSMQLEVNFRLVEAAGTGYVRLYNTSDASSPSSEVNTTSTTFGLKTSGTFKLPAGTKTYTLQVKSSEGKQLFIQSARIKVNF